MINICIEEEEALNSFGVSLKVLGVGGAGGNAVNSMIDSGDIDSVNFLIANTDAQALNLSQAQAKIQLGSKITKGLGAGSNPDIGRRAAEEDLEDLIEKIKGSDIIFLTAGLGGGTGSGALPVIARTAKELGILTVAIVTKPFLFEGKRRQEIAQGAIETLRQVVDTIIVVPNQRLLEIADDKISMLDAFALSNDVLKQAIKGISEIITKSGHINVDFADVRTIMKDMGMALMGTGRASGENRARDAALNAINSPLLENVSIKGAQGVLINITGNRDIKLYEINEAASLVYDLVSPNANIILGSVIDENIGDEIMVTVIATGFETTEKIESDKQVHAIHEEKPLVYQQQPTTPEPTLPHETHHINTREKQLSHEHNRIRPGRTDTDDLNDLDTPAFLRKKQAHDLEKNYEQSNHNHHYNNQKNSDQVHQHSTHTPASVLVEEIKPKKHNDHFKQKHYTSQ